MYIHITTFNRWLLLLALLTPLLWACAAQPTEPPRTFRAELEYFKAINDAGPARDPQMIFLLMAQYLNANQAASGSAYFSAFLERHRAELPDAQRALYLAALGLLRVAHAEQVPLLRRIAWVDDSVAMLQEAKRLSGERVYVVRWVSGVALAQLPDRFKARSAARADLLWCLAHDGEAPDGGWLREVYFQLAALDRDEGHAAEAARWLALSGYAGFARQAILTTPFSVAARTGLVFARRQIKEIVPGKVFALSGYEFTDYHFVVSHDGRQLIAIDAGTRPDAAQTVYAALKERYPGLPPLTTVLITHAHWDHVGGHHFFRRLAPAAKFYARDNYAEELQHDLEAPIGRFRYFFGTDFRMEDVADFRPDVRVTGPTELQIGGTRIALYPVAGGETADGLFIHIPEDDVLFVGDFAMPYFGAPFLNEGNPAGLLEAIDLVVRLNPRYLRHGHEPLSRLFNSPALLAHLKRTLAWLQQEVQVRIGKGESRAQIHQANLIPPFIGEFPPVQLPYLLMREQLINRLYHQHVGYWQPDLQGMDALGTEETGKALASYLRLSEGQLATAAGSMIAAGDYELAARLLGWGLAAFPDSAPLRDARARAYAKLAEKYQGFNPFKFVVYSEQIARETSQLVSPQ